MRRLPLRERRWLPKLPSLHLFLRTLLHDGRESLLLHGCCDGSHTANWPLAWTVEMRRIARKATWLIQHAVQVARDLPCEVQRCLCGNTAHRFIDLGVTQELEDM